MTVETTLIGSMPHFQPQKAVDLILKYISIPCWPQLPKKSFKEHMCVQFSEKFPGVMIDKPKQKIYIDNVLFYKTLENFYQNYIEKNFEFFKISEEYASGFYQLLRVLPEISYIHKIKIQTTGPITFGFYLKDLNGRAIFYEPEFKEIIIKHLAMKSVWQIKIILDNLKTKSLETILFYDEPYLAMYGSAFVSFSKEDVISVLEEIIKETKNLFTQIVEDSFINYKFKLKVGIHCCANTDWSMLMTLNSIDVLSFDSFEFFENFVLYLEEIKNFFLKNKYLAWGAVPNNDKIYSISFDEILNKLKHQINYLCEKGIDRNSIYNNILLTPQCGLGSTDEKLAEDVLKMCFKFKESLNYGI